MPFNVLNCNYSTLFASYKAHLIISPIIAKALRSVATMQSVKLADENCASNLSVAEASEFLVRFFQKVVDFFREFPFNIFLKTFSYLLGVR